MKEEPQAEARLGSIGEQGGRRAGSLNGSGAGSTTSVPGAFASNTIDEASDES
jgi:hypothetical protein